MTRDQVLTTQRVVFYRALLEQDWAALEQLYMENYTLVRPDGSVLTKSQVLEDLRSERQKFARIELDHEEVRMIGSVALLTGVSRITTTNALGSSESCFRLVAVYVEEAGALRLLHFQGTNLAQ